MISFMGKNVILVPLSGTLLQTCLCVEYSVFLVTPFFIKNSQIKTNLNFQINKPYYRLESPDYMVPRLRAL